MGLKPIRNHIILVMIGCFFSTSLTAMQHTATIASLLTTGDSLLTLKKYDEAKAVYKAALKINQDNIQAYIGLGKVAMAQEQWGDAGDEFNNILDRDPENTAAHYYRGICTRETGKFKALLLRKIDWDKSKQHFEKVLVQDSMYQDVLYQYALLLRYREDYKDAIRLGQSQIRLRSELVEPQVKLFQLYRYFITHIKKEELLETIDWLNQQPWDHARYAIAEKFRREGQLNKADSLFLDLLKKPLTMPKQPIYLSLARIYYEQNLPDKAQQYYWQAAEEIKTNIDADLVFEDIKYIITDQELETYRSLQDLEKKRDFFRTLWVSRDPTPAATINYRLAEHYQRMIYAEKYYEYYGFRTWANNPDKFGYLKFTKAYTLNEEFNDKGLIYIRHGKPDEWAVTINEGSPTNESWLYYQTQQTPRMTFHFLISEYSVSLWRFVPYITDPALLEDRLTWDGIYYRMLRADQLEQQSIINEMVEMSRQSVAAGLATDRHTWEKQIKLLETPFSLATFRGKQGKTILEICYAISLGDLARAHPTPDQPIELEYGFTIHDLNWQLVDKKQDKIFLPIRKSDSFIDLYRFEVQPDSYHFAFYARPKDTHLLGGWKLERRVPDYSQPGLSISDIQLATKIEPALKANKFEKNGLIVVPNPTRRFSRQVPVYIYFEIYQLTRDVSNKTSFTIEYTLTLLTSQRKGILELFSRGGKSSISTRINREGTDATSVEYLAIDAGQVKAGEYDLTVKVTDQHNGNSAIQTRRIILQ